MVTNETTHSILDPNKPLRVIRSHRHRRRYSIRKSIIIVAVVGVSATVINAEVISAPDKNSASVITISVPSNFEADDIRAEIEREIPKLVEERTRTAVSATSRRADRPKPKPAVQPSKVEVVVQFALSQQGDPYVWASAGPNAYDCSGLILRSFAQVGVRTPHFTGALISKGQRVGKAEMRRGDIVFPTAGHVGIYLGDGKFVHASSSKYKVVVADLYSFYAARRLM